jgi:uncharacterized membrane protein
MEMEGVSTMSESVQMLAAVYPDRAHAEVILDMLERMHHANTITLLDAALVTKDDQGKITTEETKELTTRKGAKRGALIAGAFGLIFPPSLIGSVIAGGAIGALAGRFRDTGIKNDQMHELADRLDSGKAALIALAEGDSVMKVKQALVGYEGTLVNEVIDEETARALYNSKAAADASRELSS